MTLRAAGSRGGEAAAFTFDLARSVVYTRQGNPAWAGQERDNAAPIVKRPDDLFFGGADADWVDFNKIQIPQADEQQRLLANLITQMSANLAPLPRFWYLPRGEKAAVVMTGDDHGPAGAGGTRKQFDRFRDILSPPGCSVTAWTCVRSTSYVYPPTDDPRPPLTDAEVKTYQDQGFEIALHPWTNCDNFTPTSLLATWTAQAANLRAAWPSLAPYRTSRTHCVVWSDWASQPKVERQFGVRYDTNYYYWPASWVKSRPGLFTGSGFPMRFADVDGTTIDVYQAATQMTDETISADPRTPKAEDYTPIINTLLDNALGPKGFYTVVTTNMHTDLDRHPGAEAIVASARARDVPVVSAKQMLDWLDVRNGSSFTDLVYEADGTLRFKLNTPSADSGLEAMLPLTAGHAPVDSLTRNGLPVVTTLRTVKGIDYAVFDAAAGDYRVAGYYPKPLAPEPLPPDPTPTATAEPEVTATPVAGAVQPPNPPTAVATPAPTATAPRAKAALGISRGSAIKATKQGSLTLRIGCAECRSKFKLQVRVKFGKRQVATRSITLAPGAARAVKLTLDRRARQDLSRRRSLTVTVLASTDDGGQLVSATASVRITAPR